MWHSDQQHDCNISQKWLNINLNIKLQQDFFFFFFSCLYNYHSGVKVLSCQFGGFLASMCEGTSPPPCELTVNKPTSWILMRGAWPAHEPRPLSVHITQPPPGPQECCPGSCCSQSGSRLRAVHNKDNPNKSSQQLCAGSSRTESSLAGPFLLGIKTRACPIRRGTNPERRVTPTSSEPREPPGSSPPPAWPSHGAPSSSSPCCCCSLPASRYTRLPLIFWSFRFLLKQQLVESL